MSRSDLAGTTLLVRHAARQDRVLASLWGLVLVGVCYTSAAATSSLYAGTKEQVAAAEAINSSPVIVALYGPVLDVHSRGELAMTKMTVLYAVFVAALFVVLVRRHTRAEEESGRTELLGGAAVGAGAPLAAAVLEAAGVAAVLGLLTAGANILAGLPLVGSLAFGASWFGIGLVAAGISAVACQLSASARTCGGLAAGAIGTAYALRAVGDVSVSWLSWVSPFGWATQLRAYSGTRWWVLGLYLASAAGLVLVAQALRARRDLGSGLLAARPGPSSGSRLLKDPMFLAWRLHRASLTVWSAATVVMGVVLGAIVPDVGGLLDSTTAREMMARLGGEGAIERSLIAAELSIVAIGVSCFGIAVVGRAAADEAAGRTEIVLATATSRARTFTASCLVAFLGPLWLLLLAGLAVATGYGVAGGDLGPALRDVVPAAAAQAPAAWVAIAITAAVFARRSSWTGAGWAVVGLFVTLGQIGELLALPSWVLGLSPYTHTPSMPVEGFSFGPEIVLAAAAAGILALAWWSYEVRDIG